MPCKRDVPRIISSTESSAAREGGPPAQSKTSCKPSTSAHRSPIVTPNLGRVEKLRSHCLRETDYKVWRRLHRHGLWMPYPGRRRDLIRANGNSPRTVLRVISVQRGDGRDRMELTCSWRFESSRGGWVRSRRRARRLHRAPDLNQ